MTAPVEKMRMFSVQAPASLIDELERRAKLNERSLAAEVRLAIKAHLEAMEQAA